MARPRQRFKATQPWEARAQVKNFRAVYDCPIGLVRWVKTIGGKVTERGLYVGFGDPVDLPAPLRLPCVTVEPVEV